MTALLNLIKCLPELLALLISIEKKIEEEEADRKVHEDINTITEAFNSKDPTKLNALFSGISNK